MILCYFNDMDLPVIEWRDSAPLFSHDNDLCGVYVWDGTNAVKSARLDKLAWARRSTPLDFVQSLREKGFVDLAIQEYRELAFSYDDPAERALAMFEIGRTHLNAAERASDTDTIDIDTNNVFDGGADAGVGPDGGYDGKF